MQRIYQEVKGLFKCYLSVYFKRLLVISVTLFALGGYFLHFVNWAAGNKTN